MAPVFVSTAKPKEPKLNYTKLQPGKKPELELILDIQLKGGATSQFWISPHKIHRKLSNYVVIRS